MVRPNRSRYFTLAHQYVSIAVRNGDLPKLDGSVPCADCGKPADEYDHRDYKKPMEVDPVCRVCNQARGPGLHRDPSETAHQPVNIRVRMLNGTYRPKTTKHPVGLPIAIVGEFTGHDLRPDVFGPTPEETETRHAN